MPFIGLRASLAAALIAAVWAGPAMASAPVLTETFNAENGGAPAANYNAFSQFRVVRGSVDLATSGGGFGVTCVGGAGSCVDPGRFEAERQALFRRRPQLVTLSRHLR